MYLLCYFLKLIGTGARQGGGVTLGFAFAEIWNPSAGAVPFPSTLQQQKDEGEEEEGKGQEGKEEEEITPVYREVLLAVFDGAAVSHQQEQDHHNHHHHPGFVWAHHRGDDEEDSSCGIKGSPHSPPAAMGFGKGCSDRVAQMDKRSNVQNNEA